MTDIVNPDPVRDHSGIWPTFTYSGPVCKQPHKCPVCGGTCKVPVGFYDDRAGGIDNREPCRSCNGTGIVWG